MTFQIDWFSVAVALFIFMVLFNVTRILASYINLRRTRKKLAELNLKLKEIDRQIEANKTTIEKAIAKNKNN
jgi:biopolymer transport protein ExbB/TolQ